MKKIMVMLSLLALLCTGSVAHAQSIREPKTVRFDYYKGGTLLRPGTYKLISLAGPGKFVSAVIFLDANIDWSGRVASELFTVSIDGNNIIFPFNVYTVNYWGLLGHNTYGVNLIKNPNSSKFSLVVGYGMPLEYARRFEITMINYVPSIRTLSVHATYGR